jgi:hypothetical protein
MVNTLDDVLKGRNISIFSPAQEIREMEKGKNQKNLIKTDAKQMHEHTTMERVVLYVRGASL